MKRASLARSAVLTLAFAVVSTACTPLDRGAREQFSRDRSCPLDRVEVRRRADLQAWDVTFVEIRRAAPPDDIARDRERLALWRKTQHEKQDGWNDDYDVYELRGCGAQVLVACNRPVEPDGRFTGRVVCLDGEYPAGSRKPW
ncbi:MAG TPA: hypothetical protein VEB43_21355 [Anaeromyxobacter sp.]|nr:hypothetical protein [Anaeromyxobacter sp.]